MPHIHHALLIEAPVETIYDALTTQEGLAGWWTPDATAKPEINTVARFPFGPDYFKEMKVTALIPSRQVTWTCIAGAEEWVGTTLSFELQAGDKAALLRSHPEVAGQLEQLRGDQATLLIFHHDDWKAYTPMFAECNYTWGQFLRSLKLFCETGKGRPWPNQHSLPEATQ
jgi:uncharacterized protein YndB with AHSA1/START domain